MNAEPACACPTCGKPTILYAFRDSKPQRQSEAYRKRIRNLIALFELEGYATYDEDLATACAVSQIMAVEGQSDHMNLILRTHMERIAAADIAGVLA